jgi:septal ring factor EnvC (AmiA/AmiB activator)
LNFKFKRRFFLAVTIVFLLPLLASANTTKISELNKLKNLISKLKSSLSVAHQKQSTIQQQLKETETSAGNTANQLATTQNKLVVQKIILTHLQDQQTKYQAQLNIQQEALATQIKAIYMLNRQSTLKMLLNNEDPNKLSRLFVYAKYLQNARLTLINQYAIALQRLYDNQHHIKIETAKLAFLKSRQQQEYSQLLTIKQQRLGLLQNVNQNIKTQQQKLNKYIADEKALAAIIKRLKAQSAKVTFTQSLNKSSKKYHWPANGRLENLFGASIAESQLTWDGVLIDAPEGSEVHSISAGKVVFSQWLQGYGLLLIIDHGHGYLSLYGRNNSLYKKVGDIVQTGDLIATVGASGGFEKPSLYFAIRYNGKPVNPSLFCG